MSEWKPPVRRWTVQQYEDDSPRGREVEIYTGEHGKISRVNEDMFTLTVKESEAENTRVMFLRDMIDARIVTLHGDAVIVIGWVNQHDGIVDGKPVEGLLHPRYRREKWYARFA